MVSEQADLVSNPLLTAAELDEMRKELAQLQLDMAEIKSWIKDSMKSKVEDRKEMKEEAFDPGGNSASFTPSVTKAASFYDRNPRQPLDNLYRNRNNESQLQNQNDDDCMKRTKTILILNGMKFFEQLVMRKLLLNFSCVVLRRWCWCWDPGGFKLKTSEEQIKLRLEKELVSKTREEKGKAVDFNDANSDSEDEVMVMEEKEIGAGFVGTAIMTDDVVVIEKDPILMQPVPQRSNVERSRDRFLDACASVCFNASGISAVLIDDGIVMDKMHPLEWQWSNNPVVCRILRLERLAVEILEEERPKGSTWTLDLFTNKFKTKLNSLADKVVTLKSIAAYRSGLDISTNVRKEDAEKGLIEDTKAGPPIRIRNKRLIDYIFICSLEVALLFDLPLQIHTGFGDEDLDLRLNNPFHLRAVLEDSRFYKCRIVLLHASYPFLKEASYLASVYSQVHLDFGLAEKMSGEVEKMLDDSAFSVTDKMCHRMVHSYEVYVCKNWRDLEDTAAVIVAFLIGMLLEWRLALVAMATIPVLTVSAVAQKMWLAGFSRGMREMHRKVFLVLEDAVRNIYTVVAFCAGNKVMELYRLQLEKIFQQSFFHGMGIGLAFGFSQFLLFACNALLLWYTAISVRSQNLNLHTALKEYIVFSFATFALVEPFGLAPYILKRRKSLVSVFSIIDRVPKIDPDDSAGLKPPNVYGSIELKSIDFCYPTRPEIMVLSNFSLKVTGGQTIAVVGVSGSGKSTIISLIERFYDPVAGQILLDGRDLKSYNLRWLRNHLGLVQQEPVIFATTIRENIIYARHNATEAEMKEAARIANAHHFISSLPHGYDTHVGMRGVDLTPGQKQRIAIARVVLKNAPILLLDEASSAIESESSRVVQEALDTLIMGNKTTILIAHRAAMMRHVDNIVVLNGGRIVEQGSHDSLVAMNGLYCRLMQPHFSKGLRQHRLV